jgi:hypothetical protein
MMETCGVRKRGCTLARTAGNVPSCATKKNMRGVQIIPVASEPKIEIDAPMSRNVLPLGPAILPATSARGVLTLRPSSLPRTPWQTVCRRT